MLKGCSRKELSARRRRKPCLANKFSTGKLQRERRPLPLSTQGETSLDLKWGASKLCGVTPPNTTSPDCSLAVACMVQQCAHQLHVHAPWQALRVPWELGSGKKSQQPQFRCSAVDPRWSIFQHPLPQNWVSLQLRARAPLCCTGPDLTHTVWPWVSLHPVPSRPGSASLLPASLQLKYDKKCVSWEVQDVELAPSQDGMQHSPTLEMLAGKKPWMACSWPKMPFGCVLIQIQMWMQIYKYKFRSRLSLDPTD